MKLVTIAIAACCLLLTACDPDRHPEATTKTETGYRVSKLFTHEGCTVYRFYDDSDRYFTKCDGQAATTSWRRSCGKNCIQPESISTEVAK